MRKKLCILVLVLLVLSTNIALSKETNGTKLVKAPKKVDHVKEKSNNDRVKRSSHDDDEKPFWANRGKKELSENYMDSDIEDQPFWGNRGRRESGSEEDFMDSIILKNLKNLGNSCKNCHKTTNHKMLDFEKLNERKENILIPFWSNQARRNTDESNDESGSSDPFWGTRGRRQESDPFWGARGRRQDDDPFWGTRGRRDEEPFWGNRGKRQFWRSRDRRDETEPFWGNRGRRDDLNPFWGSRGRREEPSPFWANRDSTDTERFWGSRGRRTEESEPFWGNRGRRGNLNDEIKESVFNANNYVVNDTENHSRLRRSNGQRQSFWYNRGRESQLKGLFQQNKVNSKDLKTNCDTKAKLSESNTVFDDRMFAEEPHFIIVERTSRSSGEIDPYFITRGKKKTMTFDLLSNASRDRRGSIEEIVKSVRNDPYYIARGKKDNDYIKIENSTASREEFLKAKSLICSAIDLMMIKNEGNKEKREANDNDRDRRAILKKLAAQLQIDPYFVSRGKKNYLNEDSLEKFINQVAGMCN